MLNEEELIQQAESGNISAVRSTLAGAGPVPPRSLDLALRAAVQHDHKDIVTLLLDRGADPNSRDDLGMTPLHDAARGDSNEVIEPLVRAGGDPNARDATGVTPLVYAIREHSGDSTDVLRMWLKNGACYDLHAAVAAEDDERVEMLLKEPEQLKTHPNHLSVLIDAFCLGNEDVIHMLFQNGLTIKAVDIRQLARGIDGPGSRFLALVAERYGVQE